VLDISTRLLSDAHAYSSSEKAGDFNHYCQTALGPISSTQVRFFPVHGKYTCFGQPRSRQGDNTTKSLPAQNRSSRNL